MFILDGLLEQQTVLDPKEVMADTASYADWVFGLFFLLGYQFSPRLADLGQARFWRIDPRADYGALNGLARHRINTDLIAANWEDLLRVTGSLATGKVKASDWRCCVGRSGVDEMPLVGRIDQIARASSVKTSASRRFTGASTPSS